LVVSVSAIIRRMPETPVRQRVGIDVLAQFPDQGRGASVSSKTGERRAAAPRLGAPDTTAAKPVADDIATFRTGVVRTHKHAGFPSSPTAT
jgi:hypothetical protein